MAPAMTSFSHATGVELDSFNHTVYGNAEPGSPTMEFLESATDVSVRGMNVQGPDCAIIYDPRTGPLDLPGGPPFNNAFNTRVGGMSVDGGGSVASPKAAQNRQQNATPRPPRAGQPIMPGTGSPFDVPMVAPHESLSGGDDFHAGQNWPRSREDTRKHSEEDRIKRAEDKKRQRKEERRDEEERRQRKRERRQRKERQRREKEGERDRLRLEKKREKERREREPVYWTTYSPFFV